MISSKDLLEKEVQVEISRLQHNILEYELRYLKKLEELQRLEADIQKFKETLEQKQKTI